MYIYWRITIFLRRFVWWFCKRARFERSSPSKYWVSDDDKLWRHRMSDPSCKLCCGRGLLFRIYTIETIDKDKPETLFKGGEIIPCRECWLTHKNNET